MGLSTTLRAESSESPVKCVQCDAEKFECLNIKHCPAVKQDIIEVIIPLIFVANVDCNNLAMSK